LFYELFFFRKILSVLVGIKVRFLLEMIYVNVENFLMVNVFRQNSSEIGNSLTSVSNKGDPFSYTTTTMGWRSSSLKIFSKLNWKLYLLVSLLCYIKVICVLLLLIPFHFLWNNNDTQSMCVLSFYFTYSLLWMKVKSIYIRIIMMIIKREACHIQYQIRQNTRIERRNNVKEGV